MYVIEHNPADGLIFLETTAERQHMEDMRDDLRGRVEEASAIAHSQIVKAHLPGESQRLRNKNDRIRVARLTYDRLSWWSRWKEINPWKDECVARRECHAGWTWIDDGRVTRVPGILPAQITVGEYNRLRHYEHTRDLMPHIYSACDISNQYSRQYSGDRLWTLDFNDEDMADVLILEPGIRYRAWATDIAADTDEEDRRKHNGR